MKTEFIHLPYIYNSTLQSTDFMRKVRAGSIYFKFTALKNSLLSLETSNSLALKNKKKTKSSKAHEPIQL